METVALSVLFSAVTTIVITALFRKEVFDYVEEICELNVEAVKEVKRITISQIERLVASINRNKKE